MVDADLSDIGFLDLTLSLEPGWGRRWWGHHLSRSGEHVHPLGAALTQIDVRVSTRCRFQSCSSRLSARENLARVIASFHQDEVLLISHEVLPPDIYGLPTYLKGYAGKPRYCAA